MQEVVKYKTCELPLAISHNASWPDVIIISDVIPWDPGLVAEINSLCVCRSTDQRSLWKLSMNSYPQNATGEETLVVT